MTDHFRFFIRVMPPQRSTSRLPTKSSVLQPMAEFVIPCTPQQTFTDVYQAIISKFEQCYAHLAGQGWFHKLQTHNGFDIPLTDSVGDLGYGPQSTIEERHLYVLQYPLDRHGSLADTSALRPPGFKRPLVTTDEQHRAKRQRLQEELYGAPIDELDEDFPVTSREAEEGEEGQDESWPKDDEGFKIPMRRNHFERRLSQHSDVVRDSQSEEQHDENDQTHNNERSEEAAMVPQHQPYAGRETTSTPLREALQMVKRNAVNRRDSYANSRAPPTPVSAEETAESSAIPESAQRPRHWPMPTESTSVSAPEPQEDVYDIASTPGMDPVLDTATQREVVTTQREDITTQQKDTTTRGKNRPLLRKKTPANNAFHMLQSSAPTIAPIEWSAKETALVISCFENGANATQVAIELLDKLKSVRTPAAIRCHKKTLRSRGLLMLNDEPSSSSTYKRPSSQAERDVLVSDDIVASSPSESRPKPVPVHELVRPLRLVTYAPAGASSSSVPVMSKAPKQTTLSFSQSQSQGDNQVETQYSGKGKGRMIDDRPANSGPSADSATPSCGPLEVVAKSLDNAETSQISNSDVLDDLSPSDAELLEWCKSPKDVDRPLENEPAVEQSEGTQLSEKECSGYNQSPQVARHDDQYHHLHITEQTGSLHVVEDSLPHPPLHLIQYSLVENPQVNAAPSTTSHDDDTMDVTQHDGHRDPEIAATPLVTHKHVDLDSGVEPDGQTHSVSAVSPDLKRTDSVDGKTSKRHRRGRRNRRSSSQLCQNLSFAASTDRFDQEEAYQREQSDVQPVSAVMAESASATSQISAPSDSGADSTCKAKEGKETLKGGSLTSDSSSYDSASETVAVAQQQSRRPKSLWTALHDFEFHIPRPFG